jgi:hypothetical protein
LQDAVDIVTGRTEQEYHLSESEDAGEEKDNENGPRTTFHLRDRADTVADSSSDASDASFDVSKGDAPKQDAAEEKAAVEEEEEAEAEETGDEGKSSKISSTQKKRKRAVTPADSDDGDDIDFTPSKKVLRRHKEVSYKGME